MNALVLGGLAVLALRWLKPAPAVDPAHPLATSTSLAAGQAGQGATGAIATGQQALPGSVVTLDQATAQAFRGYARGNSADYQTWLDHYAGALEARPTGLVVHQAPAGGFQLSDQMLAAIGLKAAKTLLDVLNGATVTQVVMDLTGLASLPASVATGLPVAAIISVGQTWIQALTSSPAAAAAELVDVPGGSAAAAGLADGTVQLVDITPALAAEPITVADLTPAAASSLESSIATGGVATGGELVLEAPPISNLGGLLQGLGIAGLAVDIGFTIASNKPDVVKGIDTALDTAAIACLIFAETGVGIVLAVVIEVVKFIFDLFSGTLFGGGLSHTEREVLETARYARNLEPMFPEIAGALTPRELLTVLIHWGSGACGGIEQIAMMTWVTMPAGARVRVGGRAATLAADTLLYFAAPGCAIYNTPANYAWGATWAGITFDELAVILTQHAATFQAEAQAGIAEWRKAPFNTEVVHLVQARIKPAAGMMARGFTLDDIDDVAAEYRRQPKLHAVANFFGFTTWQPMIGAIWAAEWKTFVDRNPHGTLTQFARELGYASARAWRDAGILSFEVFYDRMTSLQAVQAALQLTVGAPAAAMAPASVPAVESTP